jgi:hypothetical protein
MSSIFDDIYWLRCRVREAVHEIVSGVGVLLPATRPACVKSRSSVVFFVETRRSKVQCVWVYRPHLRDDAVVVMMSDMQPVSWLTSKWKGVA